MTGCASTCSGRSGSSTPTAATSRPTGALQRRLLALLVLRRGRVVSVDAAIDVLWPGGRPRDPVAALHNHLFRLRRGLPDGRHRVDRRRLPPRAGARSTSTPTASPPRSATAPTASDAAAAPRSTPSSSGGTGPAYPELDDVDDGRAEAVRLDELRIRAREARAERRLAAGRRPTAWSPSWPRWPTRSRCASGPRALLMAALAEAGRTVEALRVYDDFRRLLGDELGIEPSPALAAQHAELLDRRRGDAAWAPASRLPVAGHVAGRPRRARGRGDGDGRGPPPGHAGRPRRGRQDPAARSRSATACARRGPTGPSCCASWRRPARESAVDVVAAALAIDGRPGVGLDERVADVLGDTELVLLARQLRARPRAGRRAGRAAARRVART